MQRTQGPRIRRVELALVLALFVHAIAAETTAQLPVAWQHRHAKFTYVGMTTLYQCDALESQVKRIFVYFGARQDMRVTARCSQLLLPTRTANVEADFYVPVLADGPDAGVMMGRWAPIDLAADHPHFIGAGDCDLLEDMKGLLTDSFTLRAFDYDTSCFPNQLTFHDFQIKSEALKVSPPTRG